VNFHCGHCHALAAMIAAVKDGRLAGASTAAAVAVLRRRLWAPGRMRRRQHPLWLGLMGRLWLLG